MKVGDNMGICGLCGEYTDVKEVDGVHDLCSSCADRYNDEDFNEDYM